MRERLSASFKQFWKNRSLLSVMLLWFIAFVLLTILFLTINNALALTLGAQASTKIIITCLDIIEFLLMIYVASFFFSGFFGMLKNVIQDGSTTFDEFIPSVKRYWRAVFRLSILPSFILVAAFLPFLFYYQMYLYIISTGARPDVVFPELSGAILLTFIGLLFVIFILVLLLGFAPAAIAIDDQDAWEAAKTSMLLAKRRFGITLGATITSIAIILLFMIAASALSAVFLTFAQGKPAAIQIIANVLDFLLYIVTLSGIIIASLFLFYTYESITIKKEARKTETHVKTTHIKRK